MRDERAAPTDGIFDAAREMEECVKILRAHDTGTIRYVESQGQPGRQGVNKPVKTSWGEGEGQATRHFCSVS